MHSLHQSDTDDKILVDPALRSQVAHRSTMVSVAVNSLLSVGQVATGWLSGSQGLIADGVHSLSDLFADFVVLLANRHGQKDADDDHQYGHQRFETAASLVLGLLLLVVGVGMLWSGVHKLQDPASIARVHGAALWVALIALAAKEGLFRYMLAQAERVRSGMLVANAWHARSDAASSLVVGVGIIGNLCGYRLLDPLAALIVGLMVGKMGAGFAWQALNDLMDRAASEEDIERLQQCLLTTPGVQGVHDLRTRMMGDLIVVDAHLEVDGKLNVREGHDIAVAAQQRVRLALPVLHVMIHIDPADEALPQPD
jgi:cation diffusion facilitator family transporter